MSEIVSNVIAELKAAKPAELVELPFVKERFITLHNQFTGSENGEMEYHRQVFNYKKAIAESATLKECSPLSLYGVFLDLNVNGLSLEQGTKPDCYITTRNFNVAPKGQPAVWEKRASLSISPYGELKMRLRAGQIKYADNPVIVYEGDEFKVKTTSHGKSVEHTEVIPRKSNKIIAGFIRLVRADGSVDFSVMTMEDVERLRGYSNRQNKGSNTDDKSNELYKSNDGQIDVGFFKAKIIKHAFQTYPKVKTGSFSEMEIEEHPETSIDYGFDANQYSANGIQDVDHTVVDEFSQALNEAENSKEVETVVINNSSDPNEPEF